MTVFSPEGAREHYMCMWQLCPLKGFITCTCRGSACVSSHKMVASAATTVRWAF